MADEVFTEKELRKAASGLNMGGYLVSVINKAHQIRRLDRAHYVQVELQRDSSKRYTYVCDNARVGDYVVVPPDGLYHNEPRVTRVVALGKTDYPGPYRHAHLVPRNLSEWDYGS